MPLLLNTGLACLSISCIHIDSVSLFRLLFAVSRKKSIYTLRAEAVTGVKGSGLKNATTSHEYHLPTHLRRLLASCQGVALDILIRRYRPGAPLTRSQNKLGCLHYKGCSDFGNGPSEPNKGNDRSPIVALSDSPSLLGY